MQHITRRGLGLAAAAIAISPARAGAQTVGVTATEIKLGQTMPYSGPASAYGAVGRAEVAYFTMVNAQGGVNGRKVNVISLDDGYSPPKTVEATRRLVEEEQVLAMFAPLGTAPNSATAKYLLQKGVPNLFIGSGASKWSNHVELPLSIGATPSYRVEAAIYVKYILAQKPDAKIAILWQNDDLGKDYIAGIGDVLGTTRAKQLVASISYEVTDATVDSQAVSLQASGADAVIIAATPKFAAQFIRKIFDLGWHPLKFLSNASMGVASVLRPAGVEKSLGVMSATYFKDPLDPAWKDDPGMNAYRAMMAQYLPGSDATDAAYLTGYGWAVMMHQVLKQCGNDLSRTNLMRQATALKDFEVGVWLPGIKINTTPTRHAPITQLQLVRFNGTSIELFGQLIDAA